MEIRSPRKHRATGRVGDKSFRGIDNGNQNPERIKRRRLSVDLEGQGADAEEDGGGEKKRMMLEKS
jgi:hypothetical protein